VTSWRPAAGPGPFSVTARLTSTVVAAITGIDEKAWVPIRYKNAIYDEDERRAGLRRRGRRNRLDRVHRALPA